ncbi:DUF6266 family protein [Chitinophaga filiformis]|uniref:Uncharacterized protein n=1 Tax=Chitinophaga filiformis TaxID=104663 RepID=A0A1G8BQ35_CHIFI|nr:DUF6266 family protein [Chitinophaga filiformis]SDH35269.1 hypothetical protein SAMN04488121_111119 [Chitinophaga filiformis]
MGKYLKGILGPFSGLVGTVVGASWKGISVMRSRTTKSNKPATEGQMKQRTAFTLITEFLNPLRDLIKISFQAYQKGMTPYNAAFKVNIENAITGVYPVLAINYPQVVIGKGRLLGPPEFTMAATVAAKLDFTWVNNAVVDSTNGTDLLTILLYNPLKQSYVTAAGVAARSAQSYSLTVPAQWSTDTVHAWILFVSFDGKVNSDSRYVGDIEIQ